MVIEGVMKNRLMFAIALFLTLLGIHSCEAVSDSKIKIGGQTLSVEIADTTKSREKGLMGRKHLDPNAGMLFVYEKPQILAFWMKDTLIPLSIAFFDEKKKLIETIDMPVLASSTDQPPLFICSRPALYALEVKEHWFRENGIEKGMEFSFLGSSDSLQ
jgi:uncharacterized protein